MARVLIFGSTGEIGKACYETFETEGWEITKAPRNFKWSSTFGSFDAVVWAQGLNVTGPFSDASETVWDDVLEANLRFIIRTCRNLKINSALKTNCSLVIISSIFEKVSRKQKTVYMVSKSALSGLVRGLCVEFMDSRIRVNSVLPGVLNTQMSKTHLPQALINEIATNSFGEKLIEPRQIADIVLFLASENSMAINGQALVADGGWSNASSFRD